MPYVVIAVDCSRAKEELRGRCVIILVTVLSQIKKGNTLLEEIPVMCFPGNCLHFTCCPLTRAPAYTDS